jgi:hypothetical protein
MSKVFDETWFLSNCGPNNQFSDITWHFSIQIIKIEIVVSRQNAKGEVFLKSELNPVRLKQN